MWWPLMLGDDMSGARYSNGNLWRKNSARVKARHDDCALCHKPIDYSLPASDPWSFQVDHKVPVSKGGDRYALSNLQASHRRCNRLKSDKIEERITIDAPIPHSRNWGL